MKDSRYIKSKTKTFQKDQDYGEVIEWFMSNIETYDYEPEGTDWSCGMPGPHDPECNLSKKYVITIKELK